MSGGIGWRGYAFVGTNVMPLTSWDLDEKLSIYPSEGIHGGGSATSDGIFHSQINFAIGQTVYEGSLNGEAWGGSGAFAQAFRDLFERAFIAPKRDDGFDATTTPIILVPSGHSSYAWKYPGSGTNNKAVVRSFSLSSKAGGLVSFTADIFSAGRQTYSPGAPSTSNFVYEGVQPPPYTSSEDSNPIPYWKAQVTLSGTGESESGSTDINQRITSWDINITNNTVPIFVHNGNQFAVDVLQGIMEVTGKFSYYTPDGSFVAQLTHGATMTINLGNFSIKSDYLAFAPAPVPSGGVNAPIEREVSFRCFASSSHPSLYIV